MLYEINVYEYSDMYHSSFASIEGGMVHYKNHIGQDDFRKKVENGIIH